MITNIVMGPPILEQWLRKHYNINRVNEIEIEMGYMDTIMTIQLKAENFPEFDKNE